MSKKRVKNSKKNVGKNSNRSPARKKTVTVRVPSPLSDERVRRWDLLLRDPCSAPLTAPCYGGSDSGYLVRTVDYFIPGVTGTGFTVGQTVLADYQIYVTPFNFSSSTGIVATGGVAGSGLPSYSNFGISNFITTSTAVRSYRPIACCLKWLPSGPYGTRSGIVGLGYTAGTEVSPGAAAGGTSSAMAACQMQTNNGDAAHEVRWLPTAQDENFSTASSASGTGAGTVYSTITNIDATATSATTAVANGRFQITVCWEWNPTNYLGISLAPQAPPPFTTQQVLATISDMGKYLFEGVRTNGSIRGAIAGAAYNYLSGVNRGVRSIAYHGRSMGH